MPHRELTSISVRAVSRSNRDDWFPNADWVELDGIGHCPQLDVPLETAELILD